MLEPTDLYLATFINIILIHTVQAISIRKFFIYCSHTLNQVLKNRLKKALLLDGEFFLF